MKKTELNIEVSKAGPEKFKTFSKKIILADHKRKINIKN